MRKLKVGDWVEVRSKEEILATLDKRSRMGGLPFMPQMFQYCGQRFRVFKRAHKTCDFLYGTWGRRLTGGVHLDLRCDGEAYGSCQNGCLIFWKEAWLKQITASEQSCNSILPFSVSSLPPDSTCTEAEVWAGTRPGDANDSDDLRYTCQMTDVMKFTTLLRWWDFRQYVEDYTSGNVTLGRILRGFVYAGYYSLSEAGIGLGRALRWLYERLYGVPWPRSRGKYLLGNPHLCRSLSSNLENWSV